MTSRDAQQVIARMESSTELSCALIFRGYSSHFMSFMAWNPQKPVAQASVTLSTCYMCDVCKPDVQPDPTESVTLANTLSGVLDSWAMLTQHMSYRGY